MSATDWYVCPLCKKKAVDEISKWYGKVNEETWRVLLEIKEAWESEDSDFRVDKKDFEILNKIELKGFDYSIFIPEGSLCTVRYDSDTSLTDEGTISMRESYECDFCGASWNINKTWEQGENCEQK